MVIYICKLHNGGSYEDASEEIIGTFLHWSDAVKAGRLAAKTANLEKGKDVSEKNLDVSNTDCLYFFEVLAMRLQ